MMVDPKEGLKEKYDGTVFEPYLELIYQEGLKTAEARMRSKGYDEMYGRKYPYPNDITEGIAQRIRDTIRSLENKGLL